MSRSKICISLVALCVTMAALGSNAAAAVPTKSNTAFTCIETATGSEFENAFCNSAGPKEGLHWKHEGVGATATQLTFKNRTVGTVLRTTVGGGATVEFTATGLECIECMIENHEETIEGKTVMDATGSGGHLRFSGMTVNVAGCTVTSGELNSETLKFTTLSPTSVELTPASPVTFAVIHLNAGCSLGSTITVNGRMTWTLAGATALFSTGNGELVVGKRAMQLIGEVTVSAGTTASGTMNPLSFTAA